MQKGNAVVGPSQHRALGALVLIHKDRDLRSTVLAGLSKEPEWQLVNSFKSVESALPLLGALRVEMLIIGVDFHSSFIRSLDLLRSVLPDTPFLLVADGTRSMSVLDAVRHGASGYLLKGDIPDRLSMSLSEMRKQSFPLSSCLTTRLLREIKPAAPTHPGFAKLSERERECLERLASGHLYKEIAADMGISLETARTHIKRLFVKLEVNTRTQAAIKLLSGS